MDRSPVAAGRFYSANAETLRNEIEELFLEADKLTNEPREKNENLLALIAPHAGYVYSGSVAASAFAQIRNINPRKKVFLLGSSHHTDFNGASIYNRGNYTTPLGNVKVDTETANEIIDNSEYFNFVGAAHTHEHSLEVLIPFLQYVWGNELEIIPIVLATHSKSTSNKIAEVLQPWFTTDNLFVVSTDLSHYPDYNDAVEVDKATVDAVLSGKPEELLNQISENEKKSIPNLATSMCGWTSVLTLMHMAEKTQDVKFHSILYRNSGDAKFIGNSDRVVGYQSIAVYSEKSKMDFTLSESDKETLLQIARNSITNYLSDDRQAPSHSENISENLKTPCGAFVSIYVEGELMGCIGNIESHGKALADIVASVAVSAAYYDNRFPEITESLFDKMRIEISVLTPLKKIESLDELELGRHGILIRKGANSGTFLPQVADKTNWTKEEFVGNCSKNKALLGWDGWKDAYLYTYEAIIIRE